MRLLTQHPRQDHEFDQRWWCTSLRCLSSVRVFELEDLRLDSLRRESEKHCPTCGRRHETWTTGEGEEGEREMSYKSQADTIARQSSESL